MLENLEAFYEPNGQHKRYLALKTTDPLTKKIKNALQAEGYVLELTAAEGKIELYLVLRPTSFARLLFENSEA